jgi:hypothetical protein
MCYNETYLWQLGPNNAQCFDFVFFQFLVFLVVGTHFEHTLAVQD